jgi:hypothetical protein
MTQFYASAHKRRGWLGFVPGAPTNTSIGTDKSIGVDATRVGREL